MFSSLSNRNFRIFFLAVSFSVIGTFGQELAQAWLVLDLTHSATALGLVAGLQFMPVLLLGPWLGTFADRYSRRKLLIITQTILGSLVFTLWFLTYTHLIQIWMLCIFALAAGITGALNTPVRLGFLHELVGEDHLHNAVSLNSTVYSTGRILGPALAGLLIVFYGVAPVFLINGLSFLGVIYALKLINTEELHITDKATRGAARLRSAVSYIMKSPVLASTISMTFIVGLFTYEFPITLPALAKVTFNGDATTLAILSSALGLGAVMGGLLNARRREASFRTLPRRVTIFGLFVILLSLQQWLWLAVVAVFFAGFAGTWFTALANSQVQLMTKPEMRGRTLAIWTSAWVGSTAIGGPLIGWICEVFSPGWGLAVGGLAALLAAALGYFIINRQTATEALVSS